MAGPKKQPSGAARQKPGSTGKGAYYHIEVRPKTGFDTFPYRNIFYVACPEPLPHRISSTPSRNPAGGEILELLANQERPVGEKDQL